MANLPTSLPTKPASILDFQPILASHVSTLWDEVVAIATMLGGSYSNPITVSDSASVPTPTDVGMILDAIAYIIKNITGKSTWNDTPTQNISQLITSINNLAADGAVISLGLDAAKPAAGTVTTNRMYFATDTAKLYYSNGTTWVLVTQKYNPVGNINKALLYYEASTGQPNSVPNPNQDGQILKAVWNAGTGVYDYKWKTEGVGYLISQYITLYDPILDTFTPYSTIAGALGNANANMMVIVPAGNWAEPTMLVVRDLVQLVELQPDSVTISGKIKVAPGGYVRINKLISVADATNAFAVKIDESIMVGSTEYDTYVNIKLIQISGSDFQPRAIEIQYDLTNAVTCFINVNRVELTQSSFALKGSLIYYNNAVSNKGTFEIVFGTVVLKTSTATEAYLWRCNSAIHSSHIMTVTARYIKYTGTSSDRASIFENKNAGLGTFKLVVSEELNVAGYDASNYFFNEITVIAKKVILDNGHYVALGANANLTIEYFLLTNVSWLSNPYGNINLFTGCVINFTTFIVGNGASIAVGNYSIFLNCDVLAENIILSAMATSSSYTLTLFNVTSGTHYFYKNSFLQYVSSDDTKFIVVACSAGTCYVGNICATPQKVLQPNVTLLNSSPYANPQFMAASLYLLRNFI